MAKTVKYQITFTSGDGQTCNLRFFYEGWTGGITQLEGGARPFVLREFNSDDNIFKPIRAMLAEIEIATNVNGVKIEDFYADQDTDIAVSFGTTQYSYWVGYILQDDFQEVWNDEYHYLIIKASDGFGLLKGFQFADGNNELVGKFTPFQCLQYAMSRLPENPLIQHYVINNLYHDSMSDAVQTMPLDQCYIDAKTFQQEGTTYDDCYTAIEKINKSFSQTVFMYLGEWWFLRVEELYTSYNNNLRGFFSDLGVRYTIDKRYDVEVGVDREVKPIAPEMLRLIQKKTKFDEVDFSYEPFPETLLNETFARATYVSTSGASKLYTLNNWTFERGTFSSPITPGAGYTTGLREIYNGSLSGGLLERYIFMEFNGSLGVTDDMWLKSNTVKVFATNQINLTFDYKRLNAGSTDFFKLIPVCVVIIQSGGTYYSLNQEGNWTTTFSLDTGTPIYLDTRAGTNVVSTDWNTVQVQSKLVPATGDMTVRLYMVTDNNFTQSINYYKNFECKVLTSFESGDDVRKVTGINSKFEKTGNINKSETEEIFLDDHFSTLHKGAIFQSDGTTLTDADWYRYRFAGESYGFRKQNAIAYWEHNRINRNKIDASFFGLLYNDGMQDRPIGLINTIRFMDDDPNKVYWIANMKEIDFAAGTWTATLEEVYDETKDTPITTTFEADFTTGTYATPNILPLTLVTSGGFSIQTGNTARYDGATTLSTPVDCGIFGNVSASTYPKTITFQLQKNGVAIRTINYTINVANQPFTFNLSVTTQTIATNDTFRVVVTNASSITVNGGDMKINSPSPSQVFDTYTENYLYQ